MNKASETSHPAVGIEKKVAAAILVAFNAALSFWLWTNELGSENNTLIYLKPYFHGSVWTPVTAMPICFLFSLSMAGVLSLFPGKRDFGGRGLAFGLTFALCSAAFFAFRWMLMDTLKGFIKMPIIAFGAGLFVILPLFSLLFRLISHRWVIETGWIFVLWLWLAVAATIPLSLACLFAINGFELTNDWYLLTAVQKGYPVFWIHIAVAGMSYLYFRQRKPSRAAT